MSQDFRKLEFYKPAHQLVLEIYACAKKLPDSATRLYVSNNHMQNFADGIRTGKACVCPADVGHRSVTVCHLGVIALRSGLKLKWDPAKQRFDSNEANKWLAREMRAPWKLEA